MEYLYIYQIKMSNLNQENMNETQVSTTQESRKYERKPRVFTPEEQEKFNNKKKALELAQEEMIMECYNACSVKFCEATQQGLQYVVGFKATRTLDITNDSINVEYNNEKYTFSKKQFLENKTFQYKVRERLSPYMPSAWIRFFAGRQDNTYCLGFYPVRQR